MPIIDLISNYIIPEGTYVFKIDSYEYDDSTQKLIFKMSTSSEMTHYEYFCFLTKENKDNTFARKNFTKFARCVLNDNTLVKTDIDELIGKFIVCNVTHNKVPSRKNAGETLTFEKLSYIKSATSFEDSELIDNSETSYDEYDDF